VYINDLPIFLNKNSSPVLSADNIGVLITNPNRDIFQTELNQVFAHLNAWFKINVLSFNLDKTFFIHFKTRNTPHTNITVTANYNTITNTNRINFLGLTIENNLCWRTHLDLLLSKLSQISCAIRTIKSYMAQEVLVMVYHAYFHSVLCYGVIFSGNSHTVLRYLDCKKELFELYVVQKIETHAKIILNS
jgi:hypothetical protein